MPDATPATNFTPISDFFDNLSILLKGQGLLKADEKQKELGELKFPPAYPADKPFTVWK